jgi:hypothetical protein
MVEQFNIQSCRTRSAEGGYVEWAVGKQCKEIKLDSLSRRFELTLNNGTIRSILEGNQIGSVYQYER